MIRETIQGLIWRIWENVWAYFLYSVLGLLFVGWPIAAWVGRRRRRKALRELLGTGFLENKSYIRRRLAIAVDEESQRFAFADSKIKVICKGEEIIGVAFVSKDATASGFALETKNQNLPRIVIGTNFHQRRIGEIYRRLKTMQIESNPTANATEPNENTTTESARLEDAIGQLTGAVLSLTDTVKQLVLKDGKDRL